MDLIEKIAELDSTILLISGYDDCVIGVTVREDNWVALYSVPLIIDSLCKDMTEEEAWEYFEFNFECAYVGEKTPKFVWGDIEGSSVFPAPEGIQ